MSDLDIKDIIIQQNEHFMETYNRGDYEGMKDLYTEDGQILPPNGKVITGKEGIRDFWKGAMDMGIKSVKMHTDEVELLNDTAIEVSEATLIGEENHLIDEIKYIVIWKRQEGNWKIHRDMFNSNRTIPQ